MRWLFVFLSLVLFFVPRTAEASEAPSLVSSSSLHLQPQTPFPSGTYTVYEEVWVRDYETGLQRYKLGLVGIGVMTPLLMGGVFYLVTSMRVNDAASIVEGLFAVTAFSVVFGTVEVAAIAVFPNASHLLSSTPTISGDRTQSGTPILKKTQT